MTLFPPKIHKSLYQTGSISLLILTFISLFVGLTLAAITPPIRISTTPAITVSKAVHSKLTDLQPLYSESTASCGPLTQEAEDGILAGDFRVGTDANASGGAYIHVQEGMGNNSLGSESRAQFCFVVPKDGTYRLEGKVYALDGTSDSFYVVIEGESASTFEWFVKHNTTYQSDYLNDRSSGADPVELSLNAGSRIVDVYLREDGARLDRLALKLVDGESNGQASDCASRSISRFGINMHRGKGENLIRKELHDYSLTEVQLGWYIDYYYKSHPDNPADLAHIRIIKPRFWTDIPDFAELLDEQISENPGQIWLVGNEPDNSDQDGKYIPDASAYAAYYHKVYTYIKTRDPSAQIAIAGVVQPTPLRLRYLDDVLEEYEGQFGEKLAMDLMNTHNFIMSERMVSGDGIILWGNGVPMGMDSTDSDARYIPPRDHWDLALFKSQIVDLRVWMKENGYRSKPLMISEFGILLPDSWDRNRVGTSIFMTESFDYLLNAKDDSLGYPEDENRLVQSFAWFSLNFPNYDPATGQGLNGGLFEFTDGSLTDLGETYKAYINNLNIECDSSVTPTASPLTTPSPTETPPTPLASQTGAQTPLPTVTLPMTVTAAPTSSSGTVSPSPTAIPVIPMPPTETPSPTDTATSASPDRTVTETITPTPSNSGTELHYNYLPRL